MERKGPKLIFSETQDGKLLLEHLANIAIEDTALKWFTAYLSDWKLFIQGKIIRLLASVKHVVSQGTVLGPL